MDQNILCACIGGIISVWGVPLGVWLQQKHAEKQARILRSLAYIDRQVAELYGPITEIRREIMVLSQNSEDVLTAHIASLKTAPNQVGQPSPSDYTQQNYARVQQLNLQINDIIRDRGHLADKDTSNDFTMIRKHVEWFRYNTAGPANTLVSRTIMADHAQIGLIFQNIEKRLGEKQAIQEKGELPAPAPDFKKLDKILAAPDSVKLGGTPPATKLISVDKSKQPGGS